MGTKGEVSKIDISHMHARNLSLCSRLYRQVAGATNRRQLKKALKKRDASYSELVQRLERVSGRDVDVCANCFVVCLRGGLRSAAICGRPLVFVTAKFRFE